MTGTSRSSSVGLDASLFLLAFIPRLSYVLIARPAFAGVYWGLSSGLLASHSLAIDGVRVTDFEPVYPLFLAVARVLAHDRTLIVQLLQIAVSSVGAILLYRLVNALTGCSIVAAISAALYAFDLLLIKQASEQTDLVLSTVLTIAFVWAALDIRTFAGAAGAGVLLGIVVLTRTAALPLVGLTAALLMADRRLRSALIVTTLALVIVAPLPLRNHAVNGSWWPTRSGMNLFIGNSPYTSALLPRYDLDLLQPLAASVIDREAHTREGSREYEREADAILSRHALAYMTERPLRTVREKMRNAWYYFWPPLVPYDLAGPETQLVVGQAGEVTVKGSVPRRQREVLAYSAWYSPLLAAAIAGIVLRRQSLRCDGVLWCIAVGYVAVHAVYLPATRYRAPVSFVLFFYASVTLDWVRARVLRSARSVSQTVGRSVSRRG